MMQDVPKLPQHAAWRVAYGNFLFKRRNAVFPLFLVPLFLMFPPNFSSQWVVAAGFAAALGGQLLRLAVIGFAYIKRGGLNKQVYAEALVQTGFFALCRNPLYVGNVLILGGLLLMHGNPVVLLIGGVFFLTAYQAIIAAEETYLGRKFGEQYAAYCAAVPRWMLRLDRSNQLRGMRFNWRKTLYKDYSTCASWGSQALVLMAYREYSLTHVWRPDYFVLLAMLVLCALGVRFFKKRYPLQEIPA